MPAFGSFGRPASTGSGGSGSFGRPASTGSGGSSGFGRPASTGFGSSRSGASFGFNNTPVDSTMVPDLRRVNSGMDTFTEIDIERLSATSTLMDDTFTILPDGEEHPPVEFWMPPLEAGDSTPFRFVAGKTLAHRLSDPRAFAVTVRMSVFKLFELELPHGAEPAAAFIVTSGRISSSAPLTISLHDAGTPPGVGDGYCRASCQLKHTEGLPHAAVMLGGVPSTPHGCVLRVGATGEGEDAFGMMVRIVFRRGVNAPLYRLIGVFSSIPLSSLSDVDVSGDQRLFAHLAHTLPQEVVMQILEFYVPRAGAATSSTEDAFRGADTQFSPWTTGAGKWLQNQPETNPRVRLRIRGLGEGPFGDKPTEKKPHSGSFWGSSATQTKKKFVFSTKPKTGDTDEQTGSGFGGMANPIGAKAKPFGSKAITAPAHPYARVSDPQMLAMPRLKALAIAKYVSAVDVLAVPKIMLGPLRERGSVLGTPLGTATNLFTPPPCENLVSALHIATSSEEEGDSVERLLPQLGESMNLRRDNVLGNDLLASAKPFLELSAKTPGCCGFEFHRPGVKGGKCQLMFPLPPNATSDGPLLLIYPAQLVEADGAALRTETTPREQYLCCSWLIPANSGEVVLGLEDDRTPTAIRVLTPLCWRRMSADSLIPPQGMEPGKPVPADVPPAVLYELAGLDRATFNVHVTLTATPLFADGSEGEPVSAALGCAFTPAALAGGRDPSQLQGVTVRMANLEMTASRRGATFPLFTVEGMPLNVCMSRAVFDMREKDDGFESVVSIEACCKKDKQQRSPQLLDCTSESEGLLRDDPHGGTRSQQLVFATRFGTPKRENSLKTSTNIVSLAGAESDHQGVVKGVGGGFGFGKKKVAAPHCSYQFSSTVTSAEEKKHLPMRVKELVIFLADKNGFKHKMDGILGPSAFS